METTQTDQYRLPKHLYLLGAGRHPSTKQLRRAAGFGGRAFTLGGLPIRPNRRVTVTPHFIEKHLKEVISHIKDGTLIVQHSADKFVDEDELRAMVAVVRGEKPVGPITKNDSSKVPTLPAPPDLPETALTEPPTTEPEIEEDFDLMAGPSGEAPAPSLAAEMALQAHLATEELETAVEPQDEPQDVSEAPMAVEAVEEPQDEPEAALTTADLVEAEPEPMAAEEAPKRFLPPGYENLPKKELLKLLDERGIKVDGNRASNKKLVELLQTWLAGG